MTKRDIQWEWTFAAGFIVEQSRGLEIKEARKKLKGSVVDIGTLPRDVFLPLFLKPAGEYPIEIAFVSEGKRQRNEIRELVRSILFGGSQRKQGAAQQLALHLALATDQRSPVGLFVILAGQTSDNHRVVLWKFPADQALQADIVDGAIRIRLVEDAFSRESTYFKAAMFEGPHTESSFWKGRVEDRQARYLVKGVAEFWTADFLTSKPVFTDTHGTRVVAKALKKTINETKDLRIKEDIVSAARVLRTQGGRNLSIEEVATNYLPRTAREPFIAAAGGPEVSEHLFRFEPETLEREFRVKSVTLDGKFVLRGPLEEFDDVVNVIPSGQEGIVEVSMKGRITSESVSAR